MFFYSSFLIGIQPIAVRKLKDGTFENITGARRLIVMKELGCEEIEAVILDEIDDYSAMLYSLIENIQRDDLTPIEEGRMYKKLMDVMPNKKFGRELFRSSDNEKMKQIAKKVDKSVDTVREQISLLNLPKGMQTAIEKISINVEVEIKVPFISNFFRNFFALII